MEADSTQIDDPYPSINQNRLRVIDIRPWYDKFAEKGIGYGPSFSGLSDLQAYPGENLAIANVDLKPTSNSPQSGESVYPVHPATLDTCLQLALIACHAGQVERFKKAFVPIRIHDMSIWVPQQREEEMSLGHGVATGDLRGLRGAYARTRLFSISGASILDVREIRCVAYDGSGDGLSGIASLPRDPYTRLIWKPDIKSLNSKQARNLFPPTKSLTQVAPIFKNIDRLATFIIVQVAMVQQPALRAGQPGYVSRFLTWLRLRYESAETTRNLPFSAEALAASASRRSEVIEDISSHMSDVVEVRLIKSIYDSLLAMVSNQTSGLQVASQDSLFSNLYESGIGVKAAYVQMLKLLDLLVHKSPNMRILEIGGGTGGATRLVLKALHGDTNHKSYQDYTFTDISASILCSAEVEFSACKGMVYKILDIEKQPSEQGCHPSYDLIIASNVLHATTLAKSVQNARKLLKPGGTMLLVEQIRDVVGTEILLGAIPDYWIGTDVDPFRSPFVDKDRWNKVLSNNGFSGIDIILDDYAAPLSMTSVILTTAVEPNVSPLIRSSPRHRVYIVHQEHPPRFASTLANQLQHNNFDPLLVSFTESHVPERSRIICLIDLDGNTLDNPGHGGLDAIKGLVCNASSLIWISAGGLIQASDPKSAIMVGLLRVIATEMPTSRFISMDFEPGFDKSSIELAQAIVEKQLLIEQPTQNTASENEYGFSNGLLHVSRLVPDRHLNRRFKSDENINAAEELLPLQSQGPIGAAFGHPGLLSSLYFRADSSFNEPLKDDCVEIKTLAIGLNMKASL